MTIGILCALEQEMAALIAACDIPPTRTEAMGGYYLDGRIDGVSVVLARSGMGKVRAAANAALLAREKECSILVSTGVAGGLDPDLEVGDVVVGAELVQHDAGVIENETLQPYQPGHTPFFHPTTRFGYRPRDALRDAARAACSDYLLEPIEAVARRSTPRLVFGRILTGDQFLACPKTRARLFEQFGGQAIEMEGGAIAQIAEAFGIDFLVVRALSDLAGERSTMDFERFLDETAHRAANLTRALLPTLDALRVDTPIANAVGAP